jgi:hypothetical protein
MHGQRQVLDIATFKDRRYFVKGIIEKIFMGVSQMTFGKDYDLNYEEAPIVSIDCI